MTFWSGEKLRRELLKRQIVQPFHPDNVDCSAYTLTMGPEYFITPEFNDRSRRSLKRYLKPGKWRSGGTGPCQKLGQGTLAIPPGQFAFLLTEEEVAIPIGVIGFISLKSGVKWSGLINVSGFHVDPGFRGRLIYSVYNAGPSPIHLERGQKLFLLWLADLDELANAKDSKIHEPPQGNIPVQLVSNVDRPIHSLQSLSDKIEALGEQLRVFRSVVSILGGLLGIVLAIAAVVLAVMQLRSS